jgi:hypothetical protein
VPLPPLHADAIIPEGKTAAPDAGRTGNRLYNHKYDGLKKM